MTYYEDGAEDTRSTLREFGQAVEMAAKSEGIVMGLRPWRLTYGYGRRPLLRQLINSPYAGDVSRRW